VPCSTESQSTCWARRTGWCSGRTSAGVPARSAPQRAAARPTAPAAVFAQRPGRGTTASAGGDLRCRRPLHAGGGQLGPQPRFGVGRVGLHPVHDLVDDLGAVTPAEQSAQPPDERLVGALHRGARGRADPARRTGYQRADHHTDRIHRSPRNNLSWPARPRLRLARTVFRPDVTILREPNSIRHGSHPPQDRPQQGPMPAPRRPGVPTPVPVPALASRHSHAGCSDR
jgi:hypothetical protein